MMKMIKYDYCHYFRASPPIFFCNRISSPHPNFVIKHQKKKQEHRMWRYRRRLITFQIQRKMKVKTTVSRVRRRRGHHDHPGRLIWPITGSIPGTLLTQNTLNTQNTSFFINSSQIYIEHKTNISHGIQIKEKSIWPKSLFIIF